MNSACVLALILLASVSLGAAAVPLTPEEAAGKRLYREGLSASGEAIMARVGAADMLLPATRLPCANCHGTDGLGRPEGGVRPPQLSWSRLTSTYGQQQVNGRNYPAYNDASLATVIQQGRDPGNNRLDPSMPRFVLSMKDQRNLTAYLKRLADERDPGLDAETLHLGTLLPSQGPLAEEGATVAAVLNGSVARINEAGGIHGRQLRLTIADPGADRASAEQALERLIDDEQVFALIAPIMLLIVFDPATKAPIAPISGANIGHAVPTAAETPSASTMGIEAKVSEAEFRKTCTIGTASSSAGAAAAMVTPEDFSALPNSLPFMPCRK